MSATLHGICVSEMCYGRQNGQWVRNSRHTHSVEKSSHHLSERVEKAGRTVVSQGSRVSMTLSLWTLVQWLHGTYLAFLSLSFLISKMGVVQILTLFDFHDD